MKREVVNWFTISSAGLRLCTISWTKECIWLLSEVSILLIAFTYTCAAPHHARRFLASLTGHGFFLMSCAFLQSSCCRQNARSNWTIAPLGNFSPASKAFITSCTRTQYIMKKHITNVQHIIYLLERLCRHRQFLIHTHHFDLVRLAKNTRLCACYAMQFAPQFFFLCRHGTQHKFALPLTASNLPAQSPIQNIGHMAGEHTPGVNLKTRLFWCFNALFCSQVLCVLARTHIHIHIHTCT